MKSPIALLALSLAASCSSPTPRREPVGEPFPSVSGETLEGERFELPGDLGGEPAILLVGYVMKAQFDIDRWLLGLGDLGTPVRILEVPTIEGMVPGLIAGTIDEGMRSGIPPQDWAAVVTLYGGDADRVVALTGDEGPRNARVLLLDGSGRVTWFADRGWSASLLLELDARARELAGGEETVNMEPQRILDFSDPTTVERFSAVDDRVMGGVSRSSLSAAGRAAVFAGELSTEQNGGFASVRSAPSPVDLGGNAGVALHVRGDGRTYKLRFGLEETLDGVTYQASFATTADAWTTVYLPFELFLPTWRGRTLSELEPLDPSRITTFGLLVSDGQVGSFRLELAWLDAYREPAR